MVLDVLLPEPHQKQAEMLDSQKRRKVICAGRRVGKTTLLAMLATLRALEGRRVLELAPTADQTDAFWAAACAYLQSGIAAGAIYKNETNRVLELPTGGRIRAKTAHNADTARGDYGDVIIHDEYSVMGADVWDKITAPMTLDTDAEVIFAFTPKGRNHAWKLFQSATAAPDRWDVWHFTSFDNPYLSRAALSEITKDMSERAYQQEILAQFVEDGAGVFRNVRQLSTAQPEPAIEGAQYIIGRDWARTNDASVSSVWDIARQREVCLEVEQGLPFALQIGRLQALAARYNNALVIAEQNSLGDPLIEQAAAAGIRVMAFVTTNATKAQGVDRLALACERQAVTFQDAEAGILEMESFESSRTPLGMVKYSAPAGLHDDIVMARLFAFSGIADAGPVLLWE